MSGVVVRTVHQAVLAVAVTGVVAAIRQRSSTSRATMELRTPLSKSLSKPRTSSRTTSRAGTSGTTPRAASRQPVGPAVVPAQRRSGIERLGLGVEELVVAEHEAQDARLVAALGADGA